MKTKKRVERLCFVLSLSLFVFSIFPSPSRAQSELEKVIGAAAKEGALEAVTPNALGGPRGKSLIDAFKKKYNLDIDVTITPGGRLSQKVGRIAQEVAVGQTPTWDLAIFTDAHFAIMHKEKMLIPFDWTKLGVNPKAIYFGNTGIAVSGGIVQPVYNTQLVAPKDVPKTWDDLLDPKWKNRKLAVVNATHHFGRLSQYWGVERTMKFVKALKKQNPILVPVSGAMSKLELGEVKVIVSLPNNHVVTALRKGAPVAAADSVDPVIVIQYLAGVIKGAKHPNAARLFAAFLLTEDGQAAWEKLTGEGSILNKNSATNKALGGRTPLILDPDYALKMVPFVSQVDVILGFRKK